MAATRASDADRDACLEDIESAFADGRITDAERETRTQSALQATTLSELSALVADLRPLAPATPTRPMIGADVSRRTVRALVIGVAVPALIAVIAWIAVAAGDDTDATATPGQPTTTQPVAKDKLALHTAAGFRSFVDQTIERFGSAKVESAALYPDYASVNVVRADDNRRTERWYFSKGYEGDPSKGTRRAEQPLIDLAEVDVDALMRAVKRAPAVLGVEDITTTYLVFDDRSDRPAMSVYVSNEYSESGYWSFALDGTEISRYAFE